MRNAGQTDSPSQVRGEEFTRESMTGFFDEENLDY